MQAQSPTLSIVVHFDYFENVPEPYVAWIEGDAYKGIIVTGNTIADCVKEIGISLKVLELYRQNISKKG